MLKHPKMMAAVAACALGLSTAASAETLEWTSGQLGGGWYTMVTGLAKIIMDANPDLTIKVVPGGGTANPSKVDSGKSQLGFGVDIFTFAAVKGKGLYEGKPHQNLRLIGQSFSNSYLQFLRAKGAPYDFKTFFTDGKNANLSVTKAGSSTEKLFTYIMAQYGTSYDDLRKNRGIKINHGNYSEMASQFKDRQVDYAFGTLALPGAAYIDMILSRDAELLEIPADLAKALGEEYGYKTGVIPAGTYPKAQDRDLRTLVIGTTFDVHVGVSEDTVYKIAKALCENRDKLISIHKSMEVYDCKTATVGAPSPIHPGAARYYKEKGYM